MATAVAAEEREVLQQAIALLQSDRPESLRELELLCAKYAGKSQLLSESEGEGANGGPDGSRQRPADWPADPADSAAASSQAGEHNGAPLSSQNGRKGSTEYDNVACTICGDLESYDDNRIVLCDRCNAGYHEECHDPAIPKACLDSDVQWACADCQAKEEKESARSIFGTGAEGAARRQSADATLPRQRSNSVTSTGRAAPAVAAASLSKLDRLRRTGSLRAAKRFKR